MSKKFIIGNWKMNPINKKEAVKLFSSVAKGMPNTKKTKVVICVPFVYLRDIKNKSKKISLGAQDAYWQDTGAFTGEVSGDMVYDAGARYVLVGHSERRSMGEDNVLVNKKIKGALKSGLTPILCVGESERDEEHEYFNFIRTQLEECLHGVSRNSISDIIVAYEPIWAISSTTNRRDANPNDFMEMSIFIKKVLFDKFGKNSQDTSIIYGGSSNDKNAEEFLVKGGADGLLPGKASLSPDKFIKMIKIAEAIK